MLAVKVLKNDETHQAISWNLSRRGQSAIWEVWITRPTGKNLLIATGSEEEMRAVKNFLDYSVENDVKLAEV